MSHSDETIICPNCGHHASNNYCAQCGQATHLHKETFLGLISHFISHYFHYDSKFWQTMKQLLLYPGSLTVAYKKKQRMRYIPPISLYIFISAMFFLISSSIENYQLEHTSKKQQSVAMAQRKAALEKAISAQKELHTNASRKVVSDLTAELNKSADNLEDDNKELKEKMFHIFPKIFFFLIPVTGLIITILFAKRKENYFVDHTIFSLHYHSFWFTVMLIPLNIGDESVISKGLVSIALLWTGVYFIVAFKNVYQTGWAKAIFYSILIGFFYFVIFVAVFVAALIKLR